MKKKIRGRKEGRMGNEQSGDRCWWWLASLFMVLVLILIATACGEEQPHTEGEREGLPATIRLEVMPDETAQAQTRVDENAIKDLHVLVYNSKGELIGKNYSTSATLTVKTRSGSGCTVYAITNTGNATLFDGTVLTESKLKAMKTAALSAWDGLTTASHLVMVGSKTGITIQPGNPTSNKIGNLSVTRIAAKVTLNIGVKAGSGITITDYQVCSLPKQSYYVPNTADGATAWMDGTKATVGTASVSKTFLMYENRRGTVDSITDQKDKGGSKVPGNATYVVISGEHYFYKATWLVYLGENNTSDFNIKRNGSYTYNITLNRPGTDGADTRVEIEEMYPTIVGNNSNCYMVKPESSVTIPVERANESPIQLDGSTLHNGTYYQIQSTTTWTAALVWESSVGLITLSSESGTGPKGSFKVTAHTTTTEANGVNGGNAVVAIKSGSNILWSWHIWVTTYDGSTCFNWNNGKRDFIFMDRNLGGTTSTPGQMNTCGLFYQWGRKDPFTGIGQYGGSWNISDDSDPIRAYNSLGVAYATPKRSVPTTATPNNLTNAIRNPDCFYYNANPPYDWFVYNSSGTQNNDLWSGGDITVITAAKKSVFDPCPSGWRVPPFLSNTSPYANMDKTGGSFANDGLNWSGGGYFPASGHRKGVNGNIYSVKIAGHVCIGTPNKTASYNLYFAGAKGDPTFTDSRADAFHVRCCKDNL